MKNTKVAEREEQPTKQIRSTAGRYASKKAYFARNKDGAISKRNRDRRLAAAARRAAYWASPAGQARKSAKMNTPEKEEHRLRSLKARAARRRERRLAEQAAAKDSKVS